MPRTPVRRLSVVLLMLCALLSPLSVTSTFAQSDTLTCDDFTNQDAAQIVLDFDDEFAEGLDEDGDGEACPDLPAAGGSSGSDVELAIGTDIDDFEDAAGAPEDDADEDDFTIGTEYAGFGDFDAVFVFWLNDTAAHINVELAEELDEDDALDLAMAMLPSDVDAETVGEELDDEALLFPGESDDVADLFTDDDYDEFEVGGAAGDVRIILIPGTDGIAGIDVAIGAGDEYVGGGSGGDDTDDPVDPDDGDDPDGGDADSDAYLETVREAQEQMEADILTFTELIANAASWTDADIDELLTILTRWAELETEASSLDVPAGLEDIQTTYEDAAAALADVSINLTLFLTDNDEAALDQAFLSLTDATTLLTELDTLLADEGA